MELSIVILTYKSKGLLKQCLRHIERLRLRDQYEVIVVDNDSRDGVEALVEEQFRNVRFIQSGANRGYGAGMNIGLRAATGRYRLILNPDIAILSNELERMLGYLKQHPDVGILGPKLVNPDSSLQHTCYTFPNFLTPFYRRSFLGRLPGGKQKLEQYLMSWWDHGSNREIDWLLGACLLVPSAAFEKVGLFDERFFMYFEDVDLCRRMWAQGYKVVYFADAEIVHYHQRISAETSWIFGFFNRVTREHIKSWLKYFAKYAGAPLPRRQQSSDSSVTSP
ncbi:MAG: glycosyltransferase family 2 protein [Patescibacteria group bacterium]